MGIPGGCRQLRGSLQLVGQPSGSRPAGGEVLWCDCSSGGMRLPEELRQVCGSRQRQSRCGSGRVALGLGTGTRRSLSPGHPLLQCSPGVLSLTHSLTHSLTLVVANPLTACCHLIDRSPLQKVPDTTRTKFCDCKLLHLASEPVVIGYDRGAIALVCC